MKRLAATLMSLCLLAATSGESSQAITVTRSGSQPSRQGPAENFTGSVRIDPLFNANPPSRTSVGRVTFEPGARTAWHTHPPGPDAHRDGRHWLGSAMGRPNAGNQGR
jgi:hypothetical protein